MARLELGIHFGRQRIGDVYFAGFIARHIVGLRADGQKHHPLDGHIAGIAVLRVFHQLDALVDHPFIDNVSAVADKVFRLRPFHAEFFHRGAVHGLGGGVVKHLRKIRHRRAERYLERVRIYRFHAQRVGRLFAGQNFIDMGDFRRLQIRGIRRSGGRIDQPAPAIHKVFSHHRLAVAPFGILAQLEHPHAVIFARPRFGHGRHDFALRIGFHQPFKQIAHHIDFGHAGDLVRVERLRLGYIIAGEHAGLRRAAARFFCGFFTAAAG